MLCDKHFFKFKKNFKFNILNFEMEGFMWVFALVIKKS